MNHRLAYQKVRRLSHFAQRRIYTDFYTNSRFAKVEASPNFPKEEEKVLEYWDKIDAFKKQLEMTKHLPPFTFNDGPPFATGLPHYGHLAVGAIKDTVWRYATQNGHYVERRFGWDCHGLPIEYEIDKKLGIHTKLDYQKIGTKAYNNHCRDIVMRYSSQWETIVKRFGRWIDFKNDYKTMDINYMESVWWVFKQLWEKDLVYKGSKIMPYSTKCSTVLSNFEAGSNYKTVVDPSILVTFPLIDDPNTWMIAWTTTPWTLVSNLAIAVNPEMTYIKFQNPGDEKYYIIAEKLKADVFKKLKIKNPKVVAKFTGSEIAGKRYTPLFEYFQGMQDTGAFKIMAEDFVSDKDGTGVVHWAPGFGEDDYNACVRNNIIEPGSPPCPIDESGWFTSQISDFSGMFFKDADKDIKRDLKTKGRLIYESTYSHNYPFCWRSDTPLMYKAVTSWFIRVTDLKDDLVRNNLKAYWVPEFVQKNRFHNWLADAKDWCFSRNRIWGNPIPLWVSEDGEEIVCIGSIEELKGLSGRTDITDLHRDYIDDITIPSKKGKGQLKRIEEVFDCWFESGSMPFAQPHYPFSISEEDFQKRFPADFIAEGLDQTRGWFYTLNVISTALKNWEPYKNLIVNGLILAEDGSKMSKSKKNYPDPMDMVNQYSADSVKLYMLNSPVVRAEPLKYSIDGVKGIVREVFLPWYNSYRFLVQNIYRMEDLTSSNFEFNPELKHKTENILDKWILAANQNLIKLFRQEMDHYRLYTVIRHLLSFLDDLTKWYIRLNRDRMRGKHGIEEMNTSLSILFDVLMSTTVMMSCFTPFVSEFMYLNLRNGFAKEHDSYKESIHFLQIPKCDESLLDEGIIDSVNHMKKAVELVRQLRDTHRIPVKKPLKSVTIIDDRQSISQTVDMFRDYIQSEMNTLQIEVITDVDRFITYNIEFNHKSLGQRLQQGYNDDLRQKITAFNKSTIDRLIEDGQVDVDGVTVYLDDLHLHKQIKSQPLESENNVGITHEEYAIIIDTSSNDTIDNLYFVRDFAASIQKFRKELNLSIDSDISIFYKPLCANSESLLSSNEEEISKMIQKPVLAYSGQSSKGKAHAWKVEMGDEKKLEIELIIVDHSS